MLAIVTGLVPSDGLGFVTDLVPVSQRRITATAAVIAASADVNVGTYSEPGVTVLEGGGGVTYTSTQGSVTFVS